MVTLVERMLELHRKLAAATIPADKELYQRQIAATDRLPQVPNRFKAQFRQFVVKYR